jgi:hypothetical protein
VIKTRLHHARAMLQRYVAKRLGGDGGAGIYRFLVPRCDRMVTAVFNRLALVSRHHLTTAPEITKPA